jgi:hypothetical protein
MATEFKPISFEDDVDVAVTLTNGSTHTATAIDFQEHGLMFEYVDPNQGARRMFRAWGAVAHVVQVVN